MAAIATTRHLPCIFAGMVVLAALLSACAVPVRRAPPPARTSSGYFDPHSHMGGVLPWQAYVDLPAFIGKLEGRGSGVSEADKLRFYVWLDDSWYASHRAALGGRPFSSDQRYGLGVQATLAVIAPHPGPSPQALDGALERIFTATPFTEFDSAYAFHGPASEWLARTYYNGDAQALGEALCTAGVLELARTHITRSEQSISFIGGWRFDAKGHSPRLQSILCSARKPRELAATFARLHEAPPRVRIILMTHTDQLGENASGRSYQTFEHSGRCHASPLPAALKLAPEQMYDALLGRNRRGRDVLPANARTDFFDTLVGIDTAGPEMTCFSPAGMAYYEALVDAVYRAAHARRALGWHGKLLVHTHVGEGFTAYYARKPPVQPWRFDTVFAQLPVLDGNVVTNAEAPRDNIGMLIEAVARVRRAHPDLDDYIVIRFGHVTHATLAQAEAMARLHIEADINLDSNLATGAWSFADMPDADAAARRAAFMAARPASNAALNDLPELLIPDPADANAVAAVLGSHPLKYMLMAHVRVMLGSDGEGVEHSSMPREYALAASLIRYWDAHDPAFRAQAGDVDRHTFRANAAAHLEDMAVDRADPGD
ncbi:MAG TPA: hypothetical protein VFL63_00340 [Rhodanobacteraceae bacterium]|nr:hypothetical protein [Rhodanobacteraceae bacterium]